LNTGGGGEIRTHETFRPSGFQDRRIQPLCHPSLETGSRELCHRSVVGQGAALAGIWTFLFDSAISETPNENCGDNSEKCGADNVG
jgi:hypothetical protein